MLGIAASLVAGGGAAFADRGSPTVLQTAEDEVLAHYEQRFSLAMAAMPLRRPWVSAERAEIVSVLKRCLGIRDEWIPSLTTRVVRRSEHAGFSLEQLQFTSWPKCYGAANLYLPERASESPLPVVFLACGHGAGAKLSPGYRWLAEHLARNGVAVLVPDNIGQGERTPMGHARPVQVFGSGLSVQGLIVMESLAWLNWLAAEPRFDARKMVAVGNSGGGTLTLMLAALAQDKLAGLSSSGYPSKFEFIARKEKRHCHCNVLPRIVGELEMWQLLGCFAPKPLFIFQGKDDSGFPPDLFYQVARKTRSAYINHGAEAQFQGKVFDGLHSWDLPRRRALVEFVCGVVGLPYDESLVVEPSSEPAPPVCFASWPSDALSTDQVAAQLSGQPSSARALWEVFPIPSGELPAQNPFLRGADVRQVMAQFEAFLKAEGGALSSPPPVSARRGDRN